MIYIVKLMRIHVINIRVALTFMLHNVTIQRVYECTICLYLKVLFELKEYGKVVKA